MHFSTPKTLIACGALLGWIGCASTPPTPIVQPDPVVLETPVNDPPPVAELPPPELEVAEPDPPVEEPKPTPAAPEPPDPEETLAAALEAYESSQNFWDRGDFDNAITSVDRSFELMLDLPDNDGALVAQQKDNLRRLLAKRVIEIYASQRTAAGEVNKSLPPLSGKHVDRELKSFSGPEKEFFLASYERAGQYRPMILAKIREAGLPEQLAWLPLIESGFKPRARSHAAAMGMWQFIASTGYRFGLERDSWTDERLDPEKATDAAIAYLIDLHGIFGDWATALAAYNCGEGRVLRLIKRQKYDYLDHFWDLYEALPRETRRYVPRFFASLEIIANPSKYGMDLPEPSQPVDYPTLVVERSINLAGLDRQLGLAKGSVWGLNPELRYGTTPPRAYELDLPVGVDPDQARIEVAKLEVAPKPAVGSGYHRVRSGETLGQIARRYRTSVRTLQSLNGLRSANRIYPGQRLRLPGGARGSRSSKQLPPPSGSHRVRSGETLSIIAQRYGMSVSEIQRLNGLSGTRIYAGQDLRVAAAVNCTEGTIHVVRRGDSLWEIARRYGTSVDRIRSGNGLRSDRLQVGQRLQVTC